VKQARRILLLDDDPISQDVVGSALSSAGLEVTTAAKAVDALVLARRRRFDLVIVDYYLPDYPGTDFVRLLRQSEDYAQMPVIMLTARADELDRERLFNELSLLVLPKGCGSLQLLIAVFKCLAAVRGASSAAVVRPVRSRS